MEASLIIVSLFVINAFAYRGGASGLPSFPDEDGQVCTSQGGRFVKFSLEGKRPQMSAKGPDDLTLCRIYRKNTCCSAAQTSPALVAIRKLASNGQGSEECLLYWEAMECSICDPRIGVQQGPPVLCNSFCESLFEACRDAFFSFDSMNQVLTPCGPKDIICAQAPEWVSNSTGFCQLAGFGIPSSRSVGDTFCFDGKSNLDVGRTTYHKTGYNTRKPSTSPSSNSWKPSSRQGELLKIFLRKLESSDVVMWAIGGLVLTAGVLLMKRRILSSQRKKTAMLRIVKEAQSKQQTGSRAIVEKRTGKRLTSSAEAAKTRN